MHARLCDSISDQPPLNVKIYKYSYFLLQTLGTVSRILQQLDSENFAVDLSRQILTKLFGTDSDKNKLIKDKYTLQFVIHENNLWEVVWFSECTE